MDDLLGGFKACGAHTLCKSVDKPGCGGNRITLHLALFIEFTGNCVDNGRAHDDAIGMGCDCRSLFRRLDAETDTDRQVGAFLDMANRFATFAVSAMAAPVMPFIET